MWEAKVGEKLTIPLVLPRRTEYSGLKLGLKTFGDGFEGNPSFDIPLDADAAEAEIDLAKLKTQPGEYSIAFYGSAVAKYVYNPQAVPAAEEALQAARERFEAVSAEIEQLSANLEAASTEEKSQLAAALEESRQALKAAEAAVAAADKNLKDVTAKAKPKDTVDIVVTPPIRIRVQPAHEAEKP